MNRRTPTSQSSLRVTRRRRVRPLSVDPWAIVLATTHSLFSVVGASFHATGSALWIVGSRGAAVASVLAIVLLTALLAVPITFLFRMLDRQWVPGPGEVSSMRATMRRWFVPTFTVILMGWLPWLILHYPGAVDSDTITQRLEWIGLTPQRNHHPWFDTIVFGAFWNLGDFIGSANVGLFTYLLLQETALAAALAFGIVYVKRLGGTTAVMWTLTALGAVFPVFMTAAAVVSKDSLAAIFWIPAIVLFVEVVRTRGQVLERPWIAWAGVGLLLPLVLAKRTNMYVVLLCVAVVAFFVIRRVRWRLLVGVGSVLIAAGVVWPAVVLPMMGIGTATSTDVLTIPVQQTARVAAEHSDEVPEHEREAIDRVLRWDGLADAYVPGRSDTVKGRWDDAAPLSAKVAYAQTWLSQGLRYPHTYLSATAANTYEYFAPLTPVIFQLNLTLERYVPFWESRAHEWVTVEDVEAATVDVLSAPESLYGARVVLNELFVTFANATPTMSKAFFCSWIPLFVLAFAVRRRSALLTMATVPFVVSLAVLVASPVALPRYMLPSILGSLLLIGLCLVPAVQRQSDGGKVREQRRTALSGKPASGAQDGWGPAE